MNKLTDWIKQHQIVAFFAITFAISWGLWIPFTDALINRGADFLFPLLVIATCGPALAAIIVTAISNTKKHLPKTRATWVSFEWSPCAWVRYGLRPDPFWACESAVPQVVLDDASTIPSLIVIHSHLLDGITTSASSLPPFLPSSDPRLPDARQGKVLSLHHLEGRSLHLQGHSVVKVQ